VNNCGFPTYGFNASGGAGAGTSNVGGGGVAGSGAGGDTPGVQGGGGTVAQGGGDAGEGGAAGSGGAGYGGAAGVGGAACEYPKPVIYPLHCFDHTRGDGETGTDCGGDECSACSGTETCASNADCLSGKCTTNNKTCMQVLSAEYSNIVTDPFVKDGKFHLVLTYHDPVPTTLDLIRIRYYFNHNGVADPVLGLNSQATLLAGSGQLNLTSDQIHAQVYRTVLGPAAPNNNRTTDSYIEISFASSTGLSINNQLDIIQDFSTSGDVSFDQRSHYSFSSGSSNDTVTVYRAGKRLWGIEPPWLEFPDCAYAGGVSLNGKALTIGGDDLTAASDASLTFTNSSAYANTAAKALPTTDSATTELLTTGQTLTEGSTATWAVPNGKYYACAWLTSAASSNGLMTIQGAPVDRFVGSQRGQAAVWSLLGPYQVTVSHEALGLGVASGVVNVAGLKLYRAE